MDPHDYGFYTSLTSATVRILRKHRYDDYARSNRPEPVARIDHRHRVRAFGSYRIVVDFFGGLCKSAIHPNMRPRGRSFFCSGVSDSVSGAVTARSLVRPS
jgi:hypothetical protein